MIQDIKNQSEETAKTKHSNTQHPGKASKKIRLDVHGRPKPLMRGWLHAIATPFILAGGIVLICLASTPGLKAACSIYMACSLILFGNSAIYHLGNWSPKTTALLRRLDHANIFLLIAGTYTPMAFALNDYWRNILLIAMWSSTIVALVIHIIWMSAPRWLYVLTYIFFGVSGLGFLPLYWTSPSAGPVVVILLVIGGILYIGGAIVYARQWPNPWPKVFGFHEIFHAATILAYACQMVAAYMVVLALR